MKIMVTGRHGQLARSLARVWSGNDLVFYGSDALDLAQPGAARNAVTRAAPDLLISAAAYTAVDPAETEPALADQVNGAAPGELAEAAAGLGIPIIHVSTDYVFDGLGDQPYRETDQTAPLGAYGRSKWLGEQAVAAANPKHLILRTAWLYSPWGRNFVLTMMRKAGEVQTLNVVADQKGSPTSALDLARAIAAAAPRALDGSAPWGVYHVAGAGRASWFDLAQAVMDEASERGLPSATVTPIATNDWPTPAPRPAYSVLDSSAFGDAFGYTMPNWRGSLGEVVDIIAREAA